MATVPSEMTAVAGAILTASQWNTNVRDAVNFLIAPPLAILRQTVAQSIGNAGLVSITMDTEDLDRDGGHSTTTNTSRYTAQTAGYYDCVAVAAITNNATGPRWIALVVNSNVVPGRVAIVAPAPGGPATVMTTSGTVYLNPGDYVENQARQDSGGTLNTYVTSPYQSSLTVRWVSTA